MIRRMPLDLRSLRAEGGDENLVGKDDDDTRRIPANVLSLHDVALCCGQIVKKEREKILQHVHRLLRLKEIQSTKSLDEERIKKLLIRIGTLESEVRQLWRKWQP